MVFLLPDTPLADERVLTLLGEDALKTGLDDWAKASESQDIKDRGVSPDATGGGAGTYDGEATIILKGPERSSKYNGATMGSSVSIGDSMRIADMAGCMARCVDGGIRNDLAFIDARLSNVPQHRRPPQNEMYPTVHQHRQNRISMQKGYIYLVQKFRRVLRDLPTKSTTKTQTRKRKEQIPQNWRFYFQENNETFGRSNTTSNNEGSLLPKNDKTFGRRNTTSDNGGSLLPEKR